MARSTDIFLHCQDPYSGEHTYQIWLNRQGSFELARDGRFPAGSGAVTFADMGASPPSSFAKFAQPR